MASKPPEVRESLGNRFLPKALLSTLDNKLRSFKPPNPVLFSGKLSKLLQVKNTVSHIYIFAIVSKKPYE